MVGAYVLAGELATHKDDLVGVQPPTRTNCGTMCSATRTPRCSRMPLRNQRCPAHRWRRKGLPPRTTSQTSDRWCSPSLSRPTRDESTANVKAGLLHE
jgi:hypothetical protein